MISNPDNVSDAFSKQSVVFDALYKENKLSEYLRAKFREEVVFHLKPRSEILELNGGTGLDAIYFAEKGHHLLLTDIAPGMLEQADRKILERNLSNQMQTLWCSFHDLNRLPNKKFDHIISNFGGLNCTDNLKDVLVQLAPLLKDSGKITLMVMPKICPWELVMALKGNFKTAFRRFKKNTPAHIEGIHFLCYYYNPRYIRQILKKDFDLITLKGIFITTPPEFYENFIERYPKLFKILSRIDNAICSIFPFTSCCDHFMITFQKKPKKLL